MQPAGEPGASMAVVALASARAALAEMEEARVMVEAAVRADGSRPLVLVLRGDAGVGKTTLSVLAHLTAVVEQRASTFVPASYLTPTVDAAREGLRSLGLPGGFATLGWGTIREVLVIDEFEQLQRMAAWFFAELLAGAGANLTVIITSRRPLSDVLAPYSTLVDVAEVELEPKALRAIDVGELRQALSCFHAAHRLVGSPLARRFDEPDRVAAVRAWLVAGIDALEQCPSHADLAAVLRATYLQGAAKQRAAAAALNLPWGTYRHRLRRAIDALAQVLTRPASPPQNPGRAPRLR